MSVVRSSCLTQITANDRRPSCPKISASLQIKSAPDSIHSGSAMVQHWYPDLSEHYTWHISGCCCFSYTNNSRRNTAIHLACGGTFYYRSDRNLPLCLHEKEFCKSVWGKNTVASMDIVLHGDAAVGRWTCNWQVTGSIRGRSAFTINRSTQPCIHLGSLN